MNPIQSAWMVNSGNQRILVKETSSYVVMGTVRSLLDSLWVQLKKLSFLTSWPPWLEKQQS